MSQILVAQNQTKHIYMIHFLVILGLQRVLEKFILIRMTIVMGRLVFITQTVIEP